MSATDFSPILVPAAPARSDWRGKVAGWLATLRQPKAEDDLPACLSPHMAGDLGLPPGRSDDDRIWGVGGLLSR